MPADSRTCRSTGLLVVDMCQFLSGPYARCACRISARASSRSSAPMAATCRRRLYLSDTEIGGDSTIFHAINRAKESLALDLKNPADLAALRKLLGQGRCADAEFPPRRHRAARPRLRGGQSDQPGHRLCLDHRLWRGRPVGASGPGQDLLAQARSGVMWLNGDEDQGPVPFGLAIADMLAGAAVRAGHPRGAGAARHHRQGRPCRDQPARSAGRFPVRGADHPSQRRPPPAEALRASAPPTPISRRPMAFTRPPTAISPSP